ncbi:hypothetical protein L2E82_50600 [Cichorium intybus]|nr:hypothetical protein L2E82_50600 [Cichorium intybus]
MQTIFVDFPSSTPHLRRPFTTDLAHRRFLSVQGCTIITVLHEDIYSSEDGFTLPLQMEYLADITIKAEPLITGLAADIHGQLTVLNKGGSDGLGSESIEQQSRNFASACAPTEPKVKVPVAMCGGSGNYASALYIAAAKANALNKVESKLLDFVSATTKASAFSQYMEDLAVPTDKSEVCIKLGGVEAEVIKQQETKTGLSIKSEAQDKDIRLLRLRFLSSEVYIGVWRGDCGDRSRLAGLGEASLW